MFTDSYGEQSCTAGRAAFITGQSVYRTGLSKVGFPGMPVGLQRRGSDDRRAAQAARLRHRAVRQEPPRRPQRVPSHRPRLRRVLRQPLPPQRRGGAGAARLPDPRGVPAASTNVRPARCHPLLGDRGGRRHRRRALRAGRQATHRGHRPADQEADGDDRRRVPGRRDRLHQAPARGRTRRSSCWMNTTHMHCVPTPSRRVSARRVAGSPPITTR